MPSYEETIASLDRTYQSIAEIKQMLQGVLNSTSFSKASKDEMQANLEKQLRNFEESKKTDLEKLVLFPPHKVLHFAKLDTFHADGSYEKSVFIMTKFPDMQNPQPRDVKLNAVIDAVKKAVIDKGFIPRIALGPKYHPQLWDNVEMFLLGCGRAVAIVESKYQPELNPNVTMEWGWMRGMNRDVLYLVEETFDMGRADILGLIQDKFKWDDPEPGITQAIAAWLV